MGPRVWGMWGLGCRSTKLEYSISRAVHLISNGARVSVMVESRLKERKVD